VLKPLYHNSYKQNVNMLVSQSPVNRILYMNWSTISVIAIMRSKRWGAVLSCQDTFTSHALI